MFNNLALWGENKFVSEQERTYKFKRGVYCHTEDNSPKYRMVGEIYQCLTNVDKRLRNKCAMTCFGNMSQNNFTDKVHSLFTTHHSLKRPAFTLAEGATHVAHWNNSRKIAFTLAEVLITLGIIGVVAALTIPTLMANHRKQVVETSLEKFYSTMNQAIKMAEVDYGDVRQWDEFEYGFNEDEDGNPTTSKALAWFDKYLKPYLKYTKYEVDKNLEGKVSVYFPDGSLALISASSIIFYPNAKDYELLKQEDESSDRNRNVSGTKYFTFLFRQNKNLKYHYGKGVEPFKADGWDGTKEMLLTNNNVGCKKEVSNERAYCTALIQMNGWKIPKDYPLRF